MGFLQSFLGKPDPQDKGVGPDLDARLGAPDLGLLEAEFGSVCAPLVALYSNHAELKREHATRIPRPGAKEDEYIYICWYHPADRQSLEERWPANAKYFEFGNDGSGNTYVVDPTQEDPEILLYDHEEDVHKPTGVRLSQYLDLPEDKRSS